jgi:hypothetical protein
VPILDPIGRNKDNATLILLNAFLAELQNKVGIDFSVTCVPDFGDFVGILVNVNDHN